MTASDRFRDTATLYNNVVTGVLPVTVGVGYGLVVGISNAVLFGALVLLAAVLIALSSQRPRQRDAPRDTAAQARRQLRFDVAAPILGSLGIMVFARWVLEGSPVPLALLVAIQLIATAYVLPGRLRLPVQLCSIAIWVLTLAVLAGTSTLVWVFHLAGGLFLALVLNLTSDRQAAVQAAELLAAEEAEALTRVLVSVLQVNSLEPRVVLTAVVDGLRAIGMAVVEIRRIDQDAGVARLEAGSTSLDKALREELPIDIGLIDSVLRSNRTEVVDHVGSDPRALAPELDIQGAIVVPLPFGDGGRGVLIAASMSGPLTDLQRGAVELLADHAAKALERARGFEEDARIVEDLQRLDDRTQDFVSTASHELRTPLTVISGLGQTLRRHWEELDDTRRGDLLRRIDANADRLAVMVNSLLDTSALARGELRPDVARVPLKQTLDRLLDRLATITAAYPITVEVAEEVEVMVDAALFEHVVENLITNVAKHTPQGTWVILEAESIDGQVLVAVRDLGPGIAAEDLPHVLDRFYRGGEPTRRTSGGLGLGLALAQQIVRAHGSELEVVSEPGEGTTFRFWVPAA